MATEEFTAKSTPASFPSASDKVIWDVWTSQHHFTTLSVSLELNIFEELAKYPAGRTIDEVATSLDLGERGTEVLLALLTSLNLLRQTGGRYILNEAARNFLLKDSEFSWRAMLLGEDTSPAHLRLKKAVQDDRPTGAAVEWETGELSEERARSLTVAMHAHSMSAALVAAQALAPVFRKDGGAVTKLLDVAGGSGVFASSFCQRYEHLETTVLELPIVCRLIEAEYIAPGLASRVTTASVNMFEEDWPTGYNGHFFSNVWHDWNRDQCVNLATRSFKALPSGGRILLHEMLMNDSKDGPVTTAAFSLHMLLYTRGRQYTFGQLSEMLSSAGFVDIHAIPCHAYYSVVVGVKP